MTAQPLCQETAPGKQDVNDEAMGGHLSLVNFYIYIFWLNVNFLMKHFLALTTQVCHFYTHRDSRSLYYNESSDVLNLSWYPHQAFVCGGEITCSQLCLRDLNTLPQSRYLI